MKSPHGVSVRRHGGSFGWRANNDYQSSFNAIDLDLARLPTQVLKLVQPSPQNNKY